MPGVLEQVALGQAVERELPPEAAQELGRVPEVLERDFLAPVGLVPQDVQAAAQNEFPLALTSSASVKESPNS